MSRLLMLLFSVLFVGCLSGPDPEKDYPKVRKFINEYEPVAQDFDEPPKHFYLSSDALIIKTPKVINLNKGQFSFNIQFKGELGANTLWSVTNAKHITHLKLSPVINDKGSYIMTGAIDSHYLEDLFADTFNIIFEFKPLEVSELNSQRIKYYDRKVSVKFLRQTKGAVK